MDQMARGFVLGATAGPHHAERRGPPARGRPLARARRHQPRGRRLRPGVRLRARAHRQGRPAPDVRRRARRTSSTTSRSTTSRTRSRPSPRASTSTASCAACTCSRRPATATGRAPRCSRPASRVPWALEAQQLLRDDWGVHADVWSVTSWTELRRDGLAVDRHNLLNPTGEPRTPYVTQRLAGRPGPVVAVSDYMRAVQDQIRSWVPADFVHARHRRLGHVRHPRCAASPLPGRRREHHGAHARLARRARRVRRTRAWREAIERYHLDRPAAGRRRQHRGRAASRSSDSGTWKVAAERDFPATEIGSAERWRASPRRGPRRRRRPR